MREIKFRAWTGKQMMYQENQYLASFIRRVVMQICFEHGSTQQHESYLPNGGVIDEYLQQYTGLKDRAGKEIYEGDILVHRYPVGRSIYKAVIGKEIHDVDGQSFSYYGTHFVWMRSTDFHRHTNTTGLETDYPQTDYLEIIGNIYQHPELLKEEEE